MKLRNRQTGEIIERPDNEGFTDDFEIVTETKPKKTRSVETVDGSTDAALTELRTATERHAAEITNLRAGFENYGKAINELTQHVSTSRKARNVIASALAEANELVFGKAEGAGGNE